MSQFVWTFSGGKPVQEVTSVPLVNNTALTIDKTVPAGKIWLLKSIKIVNPDDVGRSVTVVIYKEVAKTNTLDLIISGITITAAATRMLPSFIATSWASSSGLFKDKMMVAGNVLSITWAAGGASAGGTDADGLIVEYLEIDAP